MIPTVAVLVALLVVLGLHYRERRGVEADRERERDAWAQERFTLLNRIQHPQVLQPTRDTPDSIPQEPVPDVLAMVGGVFNDPADDGG